MTSNSLQLIGIRLSHQTTNENGQSNIDCGNLWQRFEKEQIFGQIPNRIGNAVYAVYFDYQGDHTQPFSYFIGCVVQAGTVPPEGLDGLNIPEQKIETYTAKGQMPDCIGTVWKEIWASQKDRAYGFDYECYDERSHNWNDAEVDVFVSVR